VQLESTTGTSLLEVARGKWEGVATEKCNAPRALHQAVVGLVVAALGGGEELGDFGGNEVSGSYSRSIKRLSVALLATRVAPLRDRVQ
jgi:hypothetical protein